jgi:pimeloyl-ACP methyl ester carboxylesterase
MIDPNRTAGLRSSERRVPGKSIPARGSLGFHLQEIVMNYFTRQFAGVISDPRTRTAMSAMLLTLALATAPLVVHAEGSSMDKPTVVLVHGAFAGSSSWNAVIAKLLPKGYKVVAVANPLRGVKSDASYVASLLATIDGPVILVGHSYGGSVITEAATGRSNVKALVYVSGLAPDVGETASALVGKFPGSTLGPTLAPPELLADGNKDLYILQDKYPAQFCADLPAREAKLLAATQRPIIAAAFDEAADSPAWKTIPSWFLYGSLDKNIPPAAHAFMAKRAGARRVVEVKGASHVVMMSHPGALVTLIDDAAAEYTRAQSLVSSAHHAD